MRRHQLLPLCTLLGVVFAGLLPKLSAQEGKFSQVNLIKEAAEVILQMLSFHQHSVGFLLSKIFSLYLHLLDWLFLLLQLLCFGPEFKKFFSILGKSFKIDTSEYMKLYVYTVLYCIKYV